MFSRFLVVGTIGFIVDAGGTLLLAKGLGAPAWFARIPAFVAATWVTYALHRVWTFAARANAQPPRGWFAYIAATSLGALLNYAAYTAVLVALGNSGASIVAGVAVGAVVGLGFNYWMSSRVIFRG